MLFLVFQIGGDRYALESSRVVEVLPAVLLKKIPQASRGVAGLFIYEDSPVPVLDLSELALGVPSPRLMSTRIFLVSYTEPNGETHMLGLQVEKATGAIRRELSDFVQAAVAVDAAPYLGPVVTDDSGIIQRIEVNQLLPAEVRDQLFRDPVAVS